jgi:hypothetical protein
LKGLIEDPAVLQNYLLAAGGGRLLDSAEIAKILALIGKASWRQVEFSHFPSRPADAFTLKRYLARQVLDVFRELTGKVGPFSSGQKGPHGPLIDLLLACLNPFLKRIGNEEFNNQQAASLIRSVRKDMNAWLQETVREPQPSRWLMS